MGSSFGKIFRLTTWGESHGPALGVVVEGTPAGIPLTEADIQLQLDRRRVGQSKVTSPRGEKDRAEILSGVFEGRTTGAPISMITYNRDVDSSKYENLRDVFRPGHADYTYWAKYGHRDHRGGGRSSARETWGRVAAGAIARKILASVGVEIYGFTREIGGIEMETFDRDEIERNLVRCPDPVAAAAMTDAILAVKESHDSLGGVVEVRALNVPPGLGEPTFDRLDALIAQAMLSIPATKGVEIGDGFAAAHVRDEAGRRVEGDMRGHAGQVVGVEEELPLQPEDGVVERGEDDGEDDDRRRVGLPVLLAGGIDADDAVEAALEEREPPEAYDSLACVDARHVHPERIAGRHQKDGVEDDLADAERAH